MTPEHYQGERETIEKQEEIAYLLSGRVSAAALGNIWTAIKYVDRMGRKEGNSFEEDAYKAADYICRAVTGEWLEPGAGASR